MKSDIAPENSTMRADEGYTPPRVESVLTDQDLKREALYAGVPPMSLPGG